MIGHAKLAGVRTPPGQLQEYSTYALEYEGETIVTTAVFDVAMQLLAPGAPLAANGSSTGVLLYPRTFPTCDWVVYASGVVATGTYTFNLQVSDVVGGTYTTVGTIIWDPTKASGKVSQAIKGWTAQFFDNDSKFVRINYVIGGTTPGAVVGSFITKASNNPGYAVDVGDIYVAT